MNIKKINHLNIYLTRPDDRFMAGVPKDLARKWTKDSFEYFDKILFGSEGGLLGVFQTSGYQLFDDERQVMLILFFEIINITWINYIPLRIPVIRI